MSNKELGPFTLHIIFLFRWYKKLDSTLWNGQLWTTMAHRIWKFWSINKKTCVTVPCALIYIFTVLGYRFNIDHDLLCFDLTCVNLGQNCVLVLFKFHWTQYENWLNILGVIKIYSYNQNILSILGYGPLRCVPHALLFSSPYQQIPGW